MVKQFIIASLLIVSIGTYAQKNHGKNAPEKHTALKNTFEKGQLDINIGIGLLANRYYYYSNSTITPPLSISVEKAATSNLSFGGYFAYARSVYRSDGTYLKNIGGNNWAYVAYHDKITANYGVIGVRGAFHLAEYIQVENLDLYAGGMVGWAFANVTYHIDDPGYRVNPYRTSGWGGFVGSFFVGGRYRFTEKIGAFCELGYGLSYGNFGLNIKL
jgi:hypothetical protein